MKKQKVKISQKYIQNRKEKQKKKKPKAPPGGIIWGTFYD